MKTTQPRVRNCWRNLYSLILFIALFGLGGGMASAQGAACDSIRAEMKYSGQGCCWQFVIHNNQSVHWIGSVTANVLTPGASVTSASGPYGVPTTTSTSITWNFPNNLPQYQIQTGLFGCFNSPTNPVTVELVYFAHGHIPCRDTVTFDCPQQPKACFKVLEQRAECIKLPTGATGYAMTFMIQNQSSIPMTYLNLSAPGVTFSPNPFTFTPALAPGNWGTVSVVMTGASPGVLVINGVLCDTTRQRCCEGRFEINLPECKDEGCFRIGEKNVICRYNQNNQLEFVVNFNIQNLAPWPATYLSAVSMPAGVTVTPATLVLGVIPPGGWSPMQSMTISGPGALPGSTLTFVVKMCDKSRQRCCEQTVTITLPDDCKPKDCCSDFLKAIKAKPSASSNGSATLSGFMGAIGTGGSPIVKVEATLASVSINSAPAYGYFQSGSIGNPFGTAPGVPAPYGHEVIWPVIPAGVPMNTATAFTLQMKFPALAWPKKRDTLRYCVRFRFTDKNCVTCDTLICYTVVRNLLIIHHGDLGLDKLDKGEQRDGKNGGRSLQGAGVPTLGGGLSGTDSGWINLVFPEFPEDMNGASYVGLAIEAEGSELVDVHPQQSGYDFFVANSQATSQFSANSGDQLTLGLKYAGLGNRNSLPHRITLYYTIGGDTLSEEFTMVLRRDGLVGGDQLAAQPVAVNNVRTYALHLNNLNGSQEPISRLMIGTEDGATILAVGPASDDRIVELGFGSEEGIGESGLGTVALAPGSSYSPIYITVAGADNDMVRIRFATLNSDGQTISNGEVVLSNPLSSVRGADDQGVAGGMLNQSYPNPASHSATIGFSLAEGGNATLAISDAAGREVARPIDGQKLEAGEHAAYVNTATLPVGTYYYTLRVGDMVETRSMQVIR